MKQVFHLFHCDTEENPSGPGCCVCWWSISTVQYSTVQLNQLIELSYLTELCHRQLDLRGCSDQESQTNTQKILPFLISVWTRW